MPDKQTSTELAVQAVEAYNKFASQRNNDTLRKLYDILYNLNAALREEMQAMTAEPVKIIINKLEKGIALLPDEMKFVRLWLVGDAEAYSSRENDYNNWSSELTRLMKIVSESVKETANVQSIMDLAGSVEDALALIPNIQRYIESIERVKRFENATKQMDASTMLAIRNLLENKLRSPEE